MYPVEYTWITNPMPVTISAMVALSASSENAMSIGIARIPLRPVTENQRQTSHTKRTGAWGSALGGAVATSAKPTSAATNEPPTAVSASRLTPCLPMRLPKSPLTSAPSKGSPSTTASKVKWSAGNCSRRSVNMASRSGPQCLSVLASSERTVLRSRKNARTMASPTAASAAAMAIKKKAKICPP